MQAVVRMFAVIAAVALVTAVDYRIVHANSATAGFSFLVLVLASAAWVGLRESIAASIASVAAYNFFFLPPIGTFTIADPQNWVALFAFLATAITASHLSSSARRKTGEARARQEELQRMYDFSRGLILGKDYSLAGQIVNQIVESFGVESAWFYDSSTRSISKIENGKAMFDDSLLAEVAETGRIWRNEAVTALIVPVRLGGANFGSLGVAGQAIPSEVGLAAVAQLVAIAIERTRAQQAAAHMEATRESERLKSTLLDALAHEFKTPLTSVKAATTTLLSSSSLNPSDQRELITIVDEEADRMTHLVSDSVELARMGTGPITLHKEPCSSEELIYSASADLRPLIEGRDLKVTVSPDIPPISADRSLTELVLRQLLNNALKYSPAGSEIRVNVEHNGHFVVISVSNLGRGIAKRDQAQIFDKFYRVPEVRSRIPGAGMGLSISREIIEAQGGRIWVNSELGQGATFFITLPIHHSSQSIQKGACRMRA